MQSRVNGDSVAKLPPESTMGCLRCPREVALFSQNIGFPWKNGEAGRVDIRIVLLFMFRP